MVFVLCLISSLYQITEIHVLVTKFQNLEKLFFSFIAIAIFSSGVSTKHKKYSLQEFCEQLTVLARHSSACATL